MNASALRLRRRAAWLLVVALGVTALVVMTLSTTSPDQTLDPDDPGPRGGRALVEVLRDRGVDVQVVRSIDALADTAPGSGATVVMANAQYLGLDNAEYLGEITTAVDRLVLMSPSADQLAALGLPLTSGAVGGPLHLTAGCSTEVAKETDTAGVVDVRFVERPDTGTAPAALCFALPGEGKDASADFAFGAAMATVPASADHPEVVALGFASGFTNRRVDEASHAGLAVRALGRSPRLLWYQPGIGDLVNYSGEAVPSAWPRWLAPAAAVLATAVLVLAFVRGRRMGSLVVEPLPVVVRAVETTESRGRLYRRARDRGRAAAILRAATTDRLARRLALPASDRDGVPAAAAAASGMPAAHVTALLTGPEPTTDVELHTLASSLADLEERVRTS